MSTRLWVLGLTAAFALAASGKGCFRFPFPFLSPTGQADAAENGLAASVDAAIEQLGRSIPVGGKQLKLAIIPINGPGEAEGGLGRYVAARALDSFVNRGVDTLDRHYVETLRQADKQRKNGSQNLDDAKLVGIYLSCDYTLSGTIHDVGAALELKLKLTDTRSGSVAAASSATIMKSSETEAILGGKPPAGAPATSMAAPAAPVSMSTDVAIERAFLIERRKKAGGYDTPRFWDGQTLSDGDHVALQVRALEDCHISVLVCQSDNTVQVLFPEGDVTVASTKVKKGQVITLPAPQGGDSFWYPLGGPAGTETFYIIAEKQATQIANLVREMEEIQKLAAKSEKMAEPTASPTTSDAGEEKAREEARKRQQELWYLERMRAQRQEMEKSHTAFANDFKLRQAFKYIADGGEAPKDEKDLKERNLLAPVLSGNHIDVPWQGGSTSIATVKVEGKGRIVESFAVAHE